ncbi:MAG: PDZ domain-containing protein [Phycisphaerae bacterium]|nr:PDZ domain-containing protein [Phycisphaerae bacterium]
MIRAIGLSLVFAWSAAQAQSLAERPYAGVRLRDNPEGTVVSSIQPGPFAGSDSERGFLQRNDLLVSANGRTVSSLEFEELVASLRPGEELSLVIRRGKSADPLAALPVGDPSGEELRITAKLASADEYTGTIGRRTSPVDSEKVAGELEKLVRDLAVEAKSWEGVADGPQLESLLAYLMNVQRNARDALALPAIAACFAQPLSVDAVAGQFARATKELAEHPDQAHLRGFVDQFMKPFDAIGGRAPSAAEAIALVRLLRDSVSIEGPDSRTLIGTINAAPAGVSEYVLSDTHWRNVDEWQNRLRVAESTAPRTDLPAKLRESCTGDILSFERLENGRYAVTGADGENTYNMEVIEIVYDVGGNDSYFFGASANPLPETINHIITDLSGNDEYVSRSDFHGPGVAVNGFSFIDDRGGRDTYSSGTQFSIASGLFGVGVILDRDGNDNYHNLGPRSGWSIGAGVYGAGLVLDLAGNDAYSSEKLSQGAAGPFGIGAIIDASGSDVYSANGPSFASAYNTPETFLAMSQGFSMGVRGYASGGIGAIEDLEGDDHYTAGEFSQGCGYYFGLGILHDGKGNDIYDGNRYSQAAAAHQAVGILIDDAGNDRYTVKTAAGQSGAWDQSITCLIDRAGNDEYAALDLCQGGAAQQGLALLFDLGGSDQYRAGGGADSSPGIGAAAQGHSGSNEYHYDRDRMFSFSLLYDSGGKKDFFSTGRNGLLRTGVMDAAAPAKSRAWGVFSKNP